MECPNCHRGKTIIQLAYLHQKYERAEEVEQLKSSTTIYAAITWSGLAFDPGQIK